MRALDVFIVCWFIVFIVIGCLFDSLLLLAGEGPITESTLKQLPHPLVVTDAWKEWVTMDHVMLANPTWLVAISWLNIGSFLFYLVAIPLFIARDERIRSPALVWSGSMISIITIVLYEERFGPHQSPKFWFVVLCYCGYIITPFIVLVRFWNSPAFPESQKNKEA
jgi:hypothetical protein